MRRLSAVVLGAPLAVLLAAGVIVPAAIFLAYSFFGFSMYEIKPGFDVHWYRQILTGGVYGAVALNTLAIAVPTTLVSVIGGYAIAYYIVFAAGRSGRVIFMLVVVSLLASYLARVYAWRTLMGSEGIVNTLLQSVGLIDQPLEWLLFSRFPVILAEINLYMPVTALICYAGLVGVPPDVREVARDLGAGPVRTLFRITLPITGPALFAAAALAFFLSCGDYITPAFLGGPTTGQTFGTIIANRITTEGNYPLSAALSFSMIAVFAIYIAVLFLGLRASRLLPRGA
ncbi:MAG TPA: ABC transporter permease [Bauldia sp.]|nr:ABC transporter permease [Bauldia sp.]